MVNKKGNQTVSKTKKVYRPKQTGDYMCKNVEELFKAAESGSLHNSPNVDRTKATSKESLMKV